MEKNEKKMNLYAAPMVKANWHNSTVRILNLRLLWQNLTSGLP